MTQDPNTAALDAYHQAMRDAERKLSDAIDAWQGMPEGERIAARAQYEADAQSARETFEAALAGPGQQQTPAESPAAAGAR